MFPGELYDFFEYPISESDLEDAAEDYVSVSG